jgi:hypothetical protein
MARQFQWKRPHIETVSMHQRVEDNAFHVPFVNYLARLNERNFGPLPLQFSNEAPALIWNLSLPA